MSYRNSITSMYIVSIFFSLTFDTLHACNYIINILYSLYDMGDYLYNYVIGWLSNVTKDINDKNHTLKFLYHRLLHLHFLFWVWHRQHHQPIVLPDYLTLLLKKPNYRLQLILLPDYLALWWRKQNRSVKGPAVRQE